VEADADPALLEDIEALGKERVLDGTEDDLSTEDIEPAARTQDSDLFEALIERAGALQGARNDPKLAVLLDKLGELLDEGFRPVVFCRYIATAHYLADALAAHRRGATVIAITGELTPAEREKQVASLEDAELPVLVATDCLSEGINLQDQFTAVVHYDLSWNPTRHEQREGRVDRFGQQALEVRTLVLYGEDNPVDGAVLKVILRKAETIKKEFGVLVPMPDDESRVTQALMNAVLLHRRGPPKEQMSLDFGPIEGEIETAWQNASERIARDMSIFAQRKLKPDDVMPEWRRTLEALGDEEDVDRFLRLAAKHLEAPLEPWRGAWRFPLQYLPEALGDRLAAEGLAGPLRLDFHLPAQAGALFIHRTRPLVGVLAHYVLESAFDPAHGGQIAAPSAAIFTRAVPFVTTLWLLLMRNRITVTR
jgi:hypothetical protein